MKGPAQIKHPSTKTKNPDFLRVDHRIEVIPSSSCLSLSGLGSSLRLSKMWASAEGGAPEVTLETSMGSFTVEVISFSLHFVSVRLLQNPD